MATSEASYRKPEFDLADSVGVELADGQVWYLKRPRLTMRMSLDESGRPVFRSNLEGPSTDYGERVEQLDRIIEDPKSGIEQYLSALASLALPLLRAHYDLPDERLGDLFAHDGSAESNRRWGDLRLAVSGYTLESAPKAESAGSEPEPSPTA